MKKKGKCNVMKNEKSENENVSYLIEMTFIKIKYSVWPT